MQAEELPAWRPTCRPEGGLSSLLVPWAEVTLAPALPPHVKKSSHVTCPMNGMARWV